MLIQRLLYPSILKALTPGKVVVVYGPRRVGKTTLLHQLQSETSLRYKLFTGDNAADRRNLAIDEISHLVSLVGNDQLLIIDEAQKIPQIGSVLKIIVDHLPLVSVIVSGSSSLDLAQKAEVELVGRNINFILYPLSFAELSRQFGPVEAKDQLEKWLVWGSYPEAVIENSTSKRQSYLQTLVGSYLFRDILELTGVRKPKIIEDLLRLLAFQIGMEVSISELGQNLGTTKETVARYLDLLEKSFIVFNVRGFSRNLRKEISKNSRYYFWDNGIRNALINNFNSLSLRNDVGQLWENFLAIERIKKKGSTGSFINFHFWRTYDQKEIDWIEEEGGKIQGFEFKFSAGQIRAATSQEFKNAYPNAELTVVSKNNFESFIL